MALERDHGKIVFRCDGNGCHEFLETEARDMETALDALREAGWKYSRIGKDWCHFCKTNGCRNQN